MDGYLLLLLLVLGLLAFKAQGERRRIFLLAAHLRPLHIEKLIADVIQGYLRALGESDPQRRIQVWQVQERAEQQLVQQVGRLAESFAQVDAAQACVSPWYWRLVERWWPGHGFDMRQALRLHAQGLKGVLAQGEQVSAQDKAYTFLAELYLLQHTCHWYCKSKAVATARLQARHQTQYAQVLRSVSVPTRTGYQALLASSMRRVNSHRM